jgi:F0F1-type ATP synthase assembly protein I
MAVCAACGAKLTFKTHHFYKGRDLCPGCLRSVEAEEQKHAADGAHTLATPETVADTSNPAAAAALALAFVGLLVGIALGILTRPSLPLFGQLPIGAVLTRGAALTGMDVLLKSAAEESFNHVLVVAIIGTLAGAVLGWFVGQKKRALPVPHSATIGTTFPTTAGTSGAGVTTGRASGFCITCGAKLPEPAAFCPSCGTKRVGGPSNTALHPTAAVEP